MRIAQKGAGQVRDAPRHEDEQRDTEGSIQPQAAGGGGADCGTGAADGAVRGRGARHGGRRERQAGKPANGSEFP